MSKHAEKLEFDALLQQMQEAPDASAANLRLAGLDPSVIDTLVVYGGVRPSEIVGPDGLTTFGYYELWKLGFQLPRDPEGGPRKPHLRPPRFGLKQALDRLDHLRRELKTWWNGLEFRTDPDGEPSVVKLKPTLYAISVSNGAPAGTKDVCVWSTEHSATGGISISIGAAAFRVQRTVTVGTTRTLQAERGTGAHIYVEATAVLTPTRLYINGQPTERRGSRIDDLKIRKPPPIATASLPASPGPDETAEPIGVFPAQAMQDPEPPTYTESITRGKEFSLLLPAGASDKSLGLTLAFDGVVSVEHNLTMPAGHKFLLQPTMDCPGAILTPADAEPPGWE
ncbi:hypothetical protein AB0L64_40685 [Kribbella sp. NPDC051936]|uniref:hypothetical protein n=1 Tax=Kribbella sp. NPDC051936 TaxID=3154946 RepID=UPI00342D5F9A